MNAKDISGALVLVGGIVLIGLAIWVTQSAGPLWALILLIWFAGDFPWSGKRVPDQPN